MQLYEAQRCPYCARVRIVLAEKGIDYESVEIDLSNRPAELYGMNPSGRVPVLAYDGFVLPESRVIMEYLEERFPAPPLLPAALRERASVRLALERFGSFSSPYYALRRGERDAEGRLRGELGALDRVLAERPFLAGERFGMADIGYVPWVLRAEATLGIDLSPHAALAAWVERLGERPSLIHEREVVAATA